MGGKNINSGILDINVNIRYKCSFPKIVGANPETKQ